MSIKKLENYKDYKNLLLKFITNKNNLLKKLLFLQIYLFSLLY